MVSTQNKIIHRFIRNFSDYDVGGPYYGQIIPTDTQAFAIYPEDSETPGVYYVLGDGIHTYTEIKRGLGDNTAAQEYPMFTKADLRALKEKADKSYMDALINKVKEIIRDIVIDINELGQRITQNEEDITHLIENTYTKEEIDSNYAKYCQIDKEHRTIAVSSPIIEEMPNSDIATHDSNKGLGGWHEVATLHDMQTIQPSRKREGMAVYVNEVDGLYVLRNGEWRLFASQAKTDGYVYYQRVPSKEWNVYHGLIKYPSVTVVDTAKNEVLADVIYIDTNSVTIRFNQPVSGYAYLN